ncbi:hypothetical protein BDR06DRAFT_1063561 [Suillus hirtellus]|nr:hypothetical protein BDR06DRAFT_1063561 [Suillus hirtellus]
MDQWDHPHQKSGFIVAKQCPFRFVFGSHLFSVLLCSHSASFCSPFLLVGSFLQFSHRSWVPIAASSSIRPCTSRGPIPVHPSHWMPSEQSH